VLLSIINIHLCLGNLDDFIGLPKSLPQPPTSSTQPPTQNNSDSPVKNKTCNKTVFCNQATIKYGLHVMSNCLPCGVKLLSFLSILKAQVE
jgi:hypothetical protein